MIVHRLGFHIREKKSWHITCMRQLLYVNRRDLAMNI